LYLLFTQFSEQWFWDVYRVWYFQLLQALGLLQLFEEAFGNLWIISMLVG